MTDVALIEDSGREPWERLDGESSKAFAAFAHYRDSGSTRSLTNTARFLIETAPPQHRRSLASVRRQVAAWSARWLWQRRVIEFELAQDRARLAEQEAARREMEQRHLQVSNTLLYAVLARARGLTREDGTRIEPLDPNDIADWSELARVSAEAVRIERLTRGLATDISRAATSVPAAAVTQLVRTLLEASLEFVPPQAQSAWIATAERICANA